MGLDATEARYLYAIKFSDGVVKVGQTRNMRQRYKHHQYMGRRAGVTVEEIEIGLRYGSALPDEGKLIAFCRDRWPTVPGHREYFAGADFDELAAYFRALDAAAAT